MDLFATDITNVTPDPARERTLMWRAQGLCSAAQAGGIIGLAWFALSLGWGPVGSGLVFAAALVPVAVMGLVPAIGHRLSEHRRLTMLAGQLVIATALCVTFFVADAAGQWLPIVAAFVLGCGRAVFDRSALAVLHAVVDHERQHAALRDLTERYSAGQPLGIAIALAGGYMTASPIGALAAAAIVACLGTASTARHHRSLDATPSARVPLAQALREARGELARHARLRAALIGGGVGVAVSTGQAALLVSWLSSGPRLQGEALITTLLVAVLGAHTLMTQFGPWMRGRRARDQLALALILLGVGILCGAVAQTAAFAALAYVLTLLAGATLVELATRVREENVPAGLAPAIGMSAGGAWALAGAIGAMSAAAASHVLSLGEAFAALGLVATLGGAVALAISWSRIRRVVVGDATEF